MPNLSNTEMSAPLHSREGQGGGLEGLLLSSAYLAPVHYYTKMYRSALTGVPVVEERADHYVKQTYRNRCIIAGDDGPIALTIPVTPPAHGAEGAECPTSEMPSIGKVTTPPARGSGGISLSKTPMHAVLISDHGNWRHQHWQAIVSAYRSSPYFEYYADDFERIFHEETALLVDFNAALRDFVLDCLDLHPVIHVNTEHFITPQEAPSLACRGSAFGNKSEAPIGEGGGRGCDFRETIRPKIPYDFDPTFHPAPYWQVFASRHGFIPNLSIIDLLFNMGPESRIVLRNSCSS